MKIGHTKNTERLSQVKVYKRTVASRYRALRDNELDQLPEGSMKVSPKVDGELWFISISGGEVSLMATNGREITESMPLLDELRKTVGSRTKDSLIAGELFALGGEGRPRVGDVAKALGEGGDPKRLGYQAFDLLVHDGQGPPNDYGERFAVLEQFLEGGKRAKAIKTMDTAKADVAGLYEQLVASGKAEGLIARAGDGRIFKIKPAFHIDCAVIGFTQRQEAPDQVRSLLLGLIRGDGTTQVIGACGNVGTDDDRKALHAKLSGSVVSSQYRKVSGSGAMYQLVRPEVVVEVITTDVQSEDSSGDAIRQWALELDGDNGWVAVAHVNGASMLHPVLERVRDDKQVNDVDVRVAQLTDRCLPQGLDDAVTKEELPKSEVLRREAYTKESKGALAVRKLLVWKTNKEDVDPAYSAYVVHFTDYSAGRSTPIKREVRLAPTPEAAESIADAIVEKQIKKGWTRV